MQNQIHVYTEPEPPKKVHATRQRLSHLRSRINPKALALVIVLAVIISGAIYYVVSRPQPRFAENHFVPVKSSKEFNSKYNELLDKRDKTAYVPTEQDYTALLAMPGEKPFYFYEEVAGYYENQGNKDKADEYYRLAKESYESTQKTSPSYSATRAAWYDDKISGETENYER